MPENPYSIQPAGRYGPQLAGLGALIGQGRKEREAADYQQQAKAAISAAIQSRDPRQVSNVMTQYPEYQKMAQEAFGIANTETERIARDTYRRVLADPARGVEAFDVGIPQIKASGGSPDTMQMDRDLLERDPESGLQSILMGVAALSPEMLDEYERQQRGVAGGGKQTANMADFDRYQALKKTDPQGAKEFGTKVGFISKEGRELSAHLQKRLSKSTDDTIESEANASRYRVLADDILEADITGGLFGVWGEWFKGIFGAQDAVTELKTIYNGVRASQAIKNLPPGTASDPDVKLALSGFPDKRASGKYLASFLEGIAKLEDNAAEFNEFKATYISNNGHERGMLAGWKATWPPKGTQAAGRGQARRRPRQPVKTEDDIDNFYLD